MTIQFEQVVPKFLEKEKIDRSGIWNNHVTFRQGEKVHIVAPSGSGKTSLIHFLYRLRSDYDGKIFFDTKEIKTTGIEDLANLRAKNISIIFQDLRLFPQQTVFQNIEVKRVLQPYHEAGRIQEMAAVLGIAGKLQKQLRTCSYGEQQRIAIIRAMQQPFDVLLMDEPFSHLDENNRKIAMELIESEAAKRNATLVLADLKRIEYFHADNIFHL